MKKYLLLFVFSICLLPSYICHAQWTQRASLTGAARTNACGFAIGTKGYICCGFDETTTLDDLWEYDPSGNSWTQRANIPVRRQGAVAFTIGTKAYIGTGQDTTNLRDFLEWNQPTNTWTQKQNFFGTARTEASGFSIGTKGYIGTGNDGLNRYDFYEYNPSTDTWTQKTDFPQPGRNSCIGFSLNGKGYMGSGYKSGTVYQSIYEFDPSANSWTYKAMTNYPAYSIAACAVANSVAFFGTGIDDNSISYSNFTRWDPVNDTITLTPFSGTSRYNAVSFSIGSNIYIGTGYDSWVTQDLWEYTTTVGVNENSAEETINIFPNPARNSLQFSFDGWSEGKKEIEIFDLHGNKIQQLSTINKQLSVDVSSFQSGVYFLTISFEEKSAVKKFVKL